MVKVKMLVSRTDGVAPGDIIDVPAETAHRMIAAGQCEIVRGARQPEKAVLRKRSEKAAKK